ncbi:tellurium resistance protein TerZ [Psychrobacter sp. PL15]|uniref:TerD family protein n=1 Tax=unclassified Psychrobacter TaxID=196806 RepID=UPI001AE1EFB4|nr:TerD family protein [Psychrobacter sp. PL15]MEC5210228.1 tellurium resistance protein TerZ [Psychrobacter sp. PL15]
MSTATPSSPTSPPLISGSLAALGLTADTLFFSLNYKFTKTDPKGMMKRFKQNQGTIDLDLACVLYDDKCTINDIVWFKQLRDKSETVRHQGDSLDGKDRGEQALYHAPLDQEQIRLYLNKIPAHINHIGLIASSYYGQPFRAVDSGEMHLSDDEGNRAFEVSLKQLPHGCSAIWIASLRREVDDWHLTLQNLPLTDTDIQKAAQQVAHELARALPMPQTARE